MKTDSGKKSMTASRAICPVCRSSHPFNNISVFECGHCTCVECAQRLPNAQCPTCRQPARIVSRGLFVDMDDKADREEGADIFRESEILADQLFRSITTNQRADIIRFASVFTTKCMLGDRGYLEIIRGVRPMNNFNNINANDDHAGEDEFRKRRWRIHGFFHALTEFINNDAIRQEIQSLLQRVISTHGESMAQWMSAGIAPRMLRVLKFEESHAAVRSCILQREHELREDSILGYDE